MNARLDSASLLEHPNRLYLGGGWVAPATEATIAVIDSATEEICLRVAEASEVDVGRAVGAARAAFDHGPWAAMDHRERGAHLRRLAAELRVRAVAFGQIWPRESGALHSTARSVADRVARTFESYADLAERYPFEQEVAPTKGGEYGLLVREPVGVVGAIIPWNAPLNAIAPKVAPALLAGCTVVLKCAPEAPGEGYLLAEAAAAAGLPAGVLNVVAAHRAASEELVRDHRVDKITFTGSTAAGRRIASICGGRIARCTLELGGKSAAVVLDDADVERAAAAVWDPIRGFAGQVCSSLTRIVVGRARQDAMVDALAARMANVVVGDPFDERTEMGPLATEQQRDRVERYIAAGAADGARIVVGGGRPRDLGRGWYVEPTLFRDVDNASTIAQEEIFGPVLSVIPADDEDDAIAIANDTIYGLNASVFTGDLDKARAAARRLRSGTVGHNAFRTDLGVSFGGFKQSGIGREGGVEGLASFLEAKYVILDGRPTVHQ